MLYICVVPLNTTDKDCQVFSYPFPKKRYFHIILLLPQKTVFPYYFIILLSYSSLAFDQL